jgi:hypothetical protein
MGGKLAVLLLVLALLWWLYDFCGGDPRCPAMGYVMRSPIRWLF